MSHKDSWTAHGGFFMASSNRFHGWHRNSIRERERGAPQGSWDEKPRDRRTNQSQTREGFGVSSGGSRHWVTGCMHPSLEAAISLFAHRNLVRENSMSRSRGRLFTLAMNRESNGFFTGCPIFVVSFLLCRILLSIWSFLTFPRSKRWNLYLSNK